MLGTGCWVGSLSRTAAARSVSAGRGRPLVAMLLVHRNGVVSVDRLADVVFAGEPTAAAATTLRSYIARLRRVVEFDGSGSRVVTQAPGYRLEAADDAVDVPRFEALLARGCGLLARGEGAEAAVELRAGLDLWRGEAYAEFADEDWARGEAQRLAELRLVAYEALADAELAAGPSRRGGLAARGPRRRPPAARVVPGPADARALPQRAPGGGPPGSYQATARRSAPSWASTLARASPSWRGGSSPTTVAGRGRRAGPARLSAGRPAGHRSGRHGVGGPPAGRRAGHRDPRRPRGRRRRRRLRPQRSTPTPAGWPSLGHEAVGA